MDLLWLYGAALGTLLGAGVWRAALLAAAARERLLRRRVAAMLTAARRVGEGG